MATFPTTNLQPGQTGTAVKQLQDYLVSIGYMTQAQVNTGYGTYGPKTTAAVTKLQQDLGVDNSTGPGYWGPRTISKVTASISSKSPAPIQAPTPAPAPTATATATATATKSLYKSSGSYKALPDDLKGLVDMAFTTFNGTAEEQQVFRDALTKAAAIADPYAKSQLALFGAEYNTKIADTTGDFQAKKSAIETARKQLGEVLKLSGNQLNLEEQADIARATRGYDEDMLTIADQAAEKGLTFATGARSRVLSEERRTEQFQDVIQSTKRTANFKRQELELRAAQGDEDAKLKLDEINRIKGIDLAKIGQGAERILGSAGVGSLGIGGFTPVGGVEGDVETQRKRDIIDLTGYGVPT